MKPLVAEHVDTIGAGQSVWDTMLVADLHRFHNSVEPLAVVKSGDTTYRCDTAYVLHHLHRSSNSISMVVQRKSWESLQLFLEDLVQSIYRKEASGGKT